MSRHSVKVLPVYFDAIENGIKRFEVRRNDRQYKVGDTLCLREYDSMKDEYTGREIDAAITYMVTHEEFPKGVPEDFVILSIRVI